MLYSTFFGLREHLKSEIVLHVECTLAQLIKQGNVLFSSTAVLSQSKGSVVLEMLYCHGGKQHKNTKYNTNIEGISPTSRKHHSRNVKTHPLTSVGGVKYWVLHLDHNEEMLYTSKGGRGQNQTCNTHILAVGQKPCVSISTFFICYIFKNTLMPYFVVQDCLAKVAKIQQIYFQKTLKAVECMTFLRGSGPSNA